MTREELLDLNEALCIEYNETDDPEECDRILDKIADTEMVLLALPKGTGE